MDPVENFFVLCRDATLPFGHILDFTLDYPNVFCGSEWEKILLRFKAHTGPFNLQTIYIELFNFAVKQSTSKKFKKQIWREFRNRIKKAKRVCKPKRRVQKFYTIEKLV